MSMTIATSPASASDGYWTIQMICQDRTQVGPRYVCHARDDADARLIAGRLPGATRVGYDSYRIDNPAGRYARTLEIGQSESVDDPDLWAALEGARRDA